MCNLSVKRSIYQSNPGTFLTLTILEFIQLYTMYNELRYVCAIWAHISYVYTYKLGVISYMQHLEWITCHTELSFIAVSLSLSILLVKGDHCVGNWSICSISSMYVTDPWLNLHNVLVTAAVVVKEHLNTNVELNKELYIYKCDRQSLSSVQCDILI